MSLLGKFLFKMLFLLCFIAYSYGYSSILLEHGENYTIDAKNRTCVLFLPNIRPNLLRMTVLGERKLTVSTFIERVIQISDSVLIFALNSSDTILINYWLLPLSRCQLNNFYYDNEFMINLQADIYARKYPFCIFSPPIYNQVSTNITTNETCIQILDQHLNEIKCDDHCNYESKSPFIIEINNKNDVSFDMISLNEESYVYYCHLKPIVYFAGLVGIPGVFPGSLNNLKCTNKLEELVALSEMFFFMSLGTTILAILLFQKRIRLCCLYYGKNTDTEYLIH